MSLILEALRKSEAERRRGLAPDVAMELPPAAMARARPTPAWLVPAALLGAIALAAAWWWWRDDAGTPDADADAVRSQADAPRIAAPAQPAVIARKTPPASTPAPPASRPAPSPATAAVEPVRQPPAPVPVPTRIEAPAVADIGATSLPPMKLSMHMWDESPARRFVILDGQRMGEGDRNGGTTVVAIERDGVVVERDGQRARVPLP